MKNIPFYFLFIFLSASICFSGGQAEGAASATRGKYLAAQGIIIPPEEVKIDSYIAQIDYDYPKPTDASLAVKVYTGRHLVSARGQREVLQVGIQAAVRDFSGLPPLNLAFVIDKSGSMAQQDKMAWVKESFDIFIEKVRDIDFVSLIVFDNDAATVFPSTAMESRAERTRFKAQVASIEPGGGTNLSAGLSLGYEQVLSNFREEYSNRVLFLTDGIGESEGILEMASQFKEMGINVSTIGLGQNFDVDLMLDLAREGGGSSRFISDREEMKKTFADELDRMVVPAARDLKMTLDFIPDVEIHETWGYDYEIDGKRIKYYLPTLHNRDYETIIVDFSLEPGLETGPLLLAGFSLSYTDLSGTEVRLDTIPVEVMVTDDREPVRGYANAVVLQAATMMRFARALKQIGSVYYSMRDDIARINDLKTKLWTAEYGEESEVEDPESAYEALTNTELEKLETTVLEKMETALSVSREMRKELLNVRMRLDNEGFDDEIKIMDAYIDILGKELQYDEQKLASIKEDIQIAATETDRGLNAHLQNLFRELNLELQAAGEGPLVVSPFSMNSGSDSGLLELIHNTAVTEISRSGSMEVLEREKLEAVLEEQELALSGLMDTEKAVEVGRLMAARFMLTGTVVEMTETLIVFGRIINIETGRIESAAQVIIPKQT